MADHALGSRAEIEAQAVALRADLKTWEKAFASAKGGKKAGRDDIKQNPEIGAPESFPGKRNLDNVDPRLLIVIGSCQIQGIQSTEIPRVLPTPTRKPPTRHVRRPVQKKETCVSRRT